MIKKLWNDESGIVGLEYLVLATLIALALIVGANGVGVALNAEYNELANAILTINQTYSYSGYSTCTATVVGSATTDTPGTISSSVTAAPTAAGTGVGFQALAADNCL